MRSHEKQLFVIFVFILFVWVRDSSLKIHSGLILDFHRGWTENCGSNFPACREYWWLYLFIHPNNCQCTCFFLFLLACTSCLHDLWNTAVLFLPSAQHCEGSANPRALGQSSDNRCCDKAWSSASQNHLGMGVPTLQLVICLMITMAKGQEAQEQDVFKEVDLGIV